MKNYMKTCAYLVVFGIIVITMQDKLEAIRYFRHIISAISNSSTYGLSESESKMATMVFIPSAYLVNDSREYLYAQRRQVIRDGCEKVNRTVTDKTILDNRNLKIVKTHSIYYCPIPKVSSTFWEAVLTVIASKGRLTSLYQESSTRLSSMNDLSKRELIILKKMGTSFMFVRDPYSRLFSGYENKVYHPNLVFWKTFGRHVVHVIRGNHSGVYNNYGFDVKFPEFVKYILYLSETNRTINNHFSPMLLQCDPCSTHFQYIGTLETIADDADYLISKWRNDFKDVKLQFDGIDKQTTFHTARRHLVTLFSAKKVLNEIHFPFIKLMLRTWRDLQIRGHLSKHISFPFNDTDAHVLTREDYMAEINAALDIPVNRTEVKQQREEALIQAYSQVPLEDMERLRRFVLQDCLLFGYDDRPSKLFDRSKLHTEEFLYLDGLSF